MAIKVNIPHGENTASISGLYQWDYGQELEIESTDLGNMVGEVHFACSSMSEAIVVPCNFTNNIAIVAIPNECLEQSSTITAWIYEISETQGRTRKTVTIHVTPRMRPSTSYDIPTEISDRYTELITKVNEAVDKLEHGQITVKKAETAKNADSATSAENASTATHALSAGTVEMANKALWSAEAAWAFVAQSADSATSSDKASLLDVDPLYENGDGVDKHEISSTGIYAVVFKNDSVSLGSSFITVTDLKKDIYTPMFSQWQLVYDSKSKALGVFSSGETTPIIAVYKIADI